MMIAAATARASLRHLVPSNGLLGSAGWRLPSWRSVRRALSPREASCAVPVAEIKGKLPSTTERLLPWTSSVSQAKKLTMYSLSSPKQGAGRSGKVESTVDSRESVRHSGQACPEHPTTLQEPARGLSTCRGLRFRTDWGLDEADPNNDRCREIDSSHSLQSSGNRSRFLGADLGFPGVFWADAFGGEIAADSLIGPPSRAVSRRRRFFPPGVRISLPIRS